MRVGDKVKTGAGEVLVLEIQERYLILFNKEKGEFIKANNYQQDDEKLFWGQGEYYNSFNKLIENLK